MGFSPYAYVEYWGRPDEDGRVHAHLVPMGDGRVCVLEIEEACELLAQAVADCNTDRHNGHGIDHGSDEPELAYKAGVNQLLTKDFSAEFAELHRNMALQKKWGGTPPAAVLLPTQDDPEKWKVMIPDRETGDPVVYDVREKVLEGIVPTPEQAGAKPDKDGIGFKRKRRLKTSTKLRRGRARGG